MAPKRRDARERREALIRAAAVCFAEKGYTVPLEEICAEAGIGRGTLYRNFQDRMSLALAVFGQDIDEIETQIDMALPVETVIRDILLHGAKVSALFTRLAVEMPLDESNRDGFMALKRRLLALFQPIVQKAQREGVMRQETEAEDLMIAMRMISGLLLPHMPKDEVRAHIDRAMRLLMRGLNTGQI